jgi:rare lipoprotein A
MTYLKIIITILLFSNFLNPAFAEKYQGHFKVGNPYKIKDVIYHPEIDKNYQEAGYASWYGDAFANKKTANGEIFYPKEISAAHRTLPLPSMVLVTNLENGKELKLKVNDRGPFAHDRIIDLSRKAATILGFKHKGTALVEVKFLKDETEKLHKELFGKAQF